MRLALPTGSPGPAAPPRITLPVRVGMVRGKSMRRKPTAIPVMAFMAIPGDLEAQAATFRRPNPISRRGGRG